MPDAMARVGQCHLGRGSKVLRVAEAQDRHEDRAEEYQTDGKPGALAKCFGHIQPDDDQDDKIDHRDEEQQNPPGWLPCYLEQDDQIVDRDDRRPTWFASFGKQLPHSGDDENGYEQSEDSTAGASTSVLCLAKD